MEAESKYAPNSRMSSITVNFDFNQPTKSRPAAWTEWLIHQSCVHVFYIKCCRTNYIIVVIICIVSIIITVIIIDIFIAFIIVILEGWINFILYKVETNNIRLRFLIDWIICIIIITIIIITIIRIIFIVIMLLCCYRCYHYVIVIIIDVFIVVIIKLYTSSYFTKRHSRSTRVDR